MPSFAPISEPGIHQWFSSYEQLQQLYPKPIRDLAERHWTPLEISKMAVEFLVPYSGAKVLDIGSGVGKFVLAGAYLKPEAVFFGVEQRKNLMLYAEAARNILGLQNAHFFHRNFTQLHFKPFDHFYFYNSFYENLVDTGRIDDRTMGFPELYNFYTRALYKKLEAMPIGTRVVTFHCLEGKLPPAYHLVEQQVGSLLKFWMKL